MIEFINLWLKFDFHLDITNSSKSKYYLSESYYSLSNKAIENFVLGVINTQKAKLKAEEPFVYKFKRAFNFSEAQFKWVLNV